MTLRFKEPVTTRMFVDACEALGVDRDLAWSQPMMAGESIDMEAITLEMARAFMEIILVEVPEVDEEKFKAIAAYCVSGDQGFFSIQRERYFEAHEREILASLGVA